MWGETEASTMVNVIVTAHGVLRAAARPAANSNGRSSSSSNSGIVLTGVEDSGSSMSCQSFSRKVLG